MGQKPVAVARVNSRVTITVEDYGGQNPLSQAGVFRTGDNWSALSHRRER
jgi:hypothetical protein